MKYVALSAIGITSGVSHMTDKWELTPRATVMFYVGACNGIIAVNSFSHFFFDNRIIFIPVIFSHTMIPIK